MKRDNPAPLRTIDIYGRLDFRNPLMCALVSKFDSPYGRFQTAVENGTVPHSPFRDGTSEDDLKMLKALLEQR
jgi:hypothetical protein